MKPTLSDLVKRRSRRLLEEPTTLQPGDVGYEETLRYAISLPMYNAISTRMRFTPPEELRRLLDGMAEELHRRVKGS